MAIIWEGNPGLRGNFGDWEKIQMYGYWNQSALDYPQNNPRLRSISNFAGRPCARHEVRAGEITDQGYAVRTDYYAFPDRFLGPGKWDGWATPDISGLNMSFNFAFYFPDTETEKYRPWAHENNNILWNIHTGDHQPGSIITVFVKANSLPWKLRLWIAGGANSVAESNNFRTAPYWWNYDLMTLTDNNGNWLPSVTNRWHDFQYNVLWRGDYNGWFEIWQNGSNVIPRTFHPTCFVNDGGPHLKTAHYTSAGFHAVSGTPSVIYQGKTISKDYQAGQQLPYAPASDTTAPQTTIVSTPASPTESKTAVFTWTSNETGSIFDHRVDNGAWSRDTDGSATYNNLSVGTHTLEVKAIDPAGNTDASPATYTWTIINPPENPPIFRSHATSKSG